MWIWSGWCEGVSGGAVRWRGGAVGSTVESTVQWYGWRTVVRLENSGTVGEQWYGWRTVVRLENSGTVGEQWYGWRTVVRLENSGTARRRGRGNVSAGVSWCVCGLVWCGVSVSWCGSALVSLEWESRGDGERLVHKIQKKFLKGDLNQLVHKKQEKKK